MATSIRLTPKLERLVASVARRRKQTKSEVIRNALSGLAREEERHRRSTTPYAAMKHLIGCASGGPPDLSERTGEKFLTVLRRKKPPR